MDDADASSAMLHLQEARFTPKIVGHAFLRDYFVNEDDDQLRKNFIDEAGDPAGVTAFARDAMHPEAIS